MYRLSLSSRYRRQVKRMVKNNKKVQKKLEEVINCLLSGEILPQKYKDHKLKGEFVGYRECHVFPDVLLVYEKKEKELILHLFDIDSHSGLFK